MADKVASIIDYKVIETRWSVVCGCPTPIGKVECKSETEARGMLAHHINQTEHQEWKKSNEDT